MRWGGFSLKERAWLNITNQQRAYEEQPLLLYTLASSSGVLPAGKQLVLPRFASFCTVTYTPRGLHFPPAVVLCSVKGSANKPSPGAAAPTSAAVADGPRESPWDGLELLECVCVCRDLASCTLEEICLLLEEGHLDTTNMGRAAADALLHRSMAAGDDELLLMLVQADVCLRCSHSVQQLLLTYACQVRLYACKQGDNGSLLRDETCRPVCTGSMPFADICEAVLAHTVVQHELMRCDYVPCTSSLPYSQ